MTKDIAVFYHADCTDGFAAAYCAWVKFREMAEYIPVHYGSKLPDPETLAGKNVYVLDFSFPVDYTEWVRGVSDKFVWLDHHKTALDRYGDNPYVLISNDDTYILLDNSKSGAMLAWEYFHYGMLVPDFITMIDDRDRWVFADPDSKAFHAGLQLMKPWSFEQWREIFYTTPPVISSGQTILTYQKIQIEQDAKQARKVRVNGEVGLAVNATQNISELGHHLCSISKTFALIWYMGADGKIKCSLRSENDFDVSAIAKSFGGGGHKNAAGFETDIETLIDFFA